jgi:hypothetical protein
MFSKRFALTPLLFIVVAQAGLSPGARAEQPILVWQEGRQFDGRSQPVVVPHTRNSCSPAERWCSISRPTA